MNKCLLKSKVPFITLWGYISQSGSGFQKFGFIKGVDKTWVLFVSALLVRKDLLLYLTEQDC